MDLPVLLPGHRISGSFAEYSAQRVSVDNNGRAEDDRIF